MLLLDEQEPYPLREVLPATSFHSSVGGTENPEPFSPDALATAPWLYSPWGGTPTLTDEAVLIADLDAEQSCAEELVLLCSEEADESLHSAVHRHVTTAAPRRVVRFPWGDVPAPWVSGYSTVFDAGIDDAVFALDLEECVLTSLSGDDDPSWSAASTGNESQK